jgi:hypothetical protein
MAAASLHDMSALGERSVFDLWRRVFLPTLGVFLLIHFPARLAAHASISRSGLREYWPHPITGVIVSNLVLLASFVLVEGTLIAYAAASAQRETSLEAALRTSFKRFPRLVAARFLYFVAVACGLVLFVVPGVVVAVLFSMHAWAVIVEDRSALSSLRRSWQLVRGRVGGTFRRLVPATVASAVWLAAGFVIVGFLLQAIRPFPVFKVAPLVMAIVETGIILPVLAVGVLFSRYRSTAK